MEKGKFLHQFLVIINTIAVVIYAVPIVLMLLFANDSYFGFNGTAEPLMWFMMLVPFLLGLVSVIYSFKSKISYVQKSYVDVIALLVLLVPFLFIVYWG